MTDQNIPTLSFISSLLAAIAIFGAIELSPISPYVNWEVVAVSLGFAFPFIYGLLKMKLTKWLFELSVSKKSVEEKLAEFDQHLKDLEQNNHNP